MVARRDVRRLQRHRRRRRRRRRDALPPVPDGARRQRRRVRLRAADRAGREATAVRNDGRGDGHGDGRRLAGVHPVGKRGHLLTADVGRQQKVSPSLRRSSAAVCVS